MPNPLKKTDPEVYEAIRKEGLRQREKVLLIASENFASPAVLAAQGSLITNNYAEGCPGRRYYGGCQHRHVGEPLPLGRAEQSFGGVPVDGQRHAGPPADTAVYSPALKAVGAYLMVDIAHIAGLIATGLHPSPIPYADFVTTTTHKTLRGPRGGMVMCKAEYAKALDKAVFPGLQGGPLMHVIAAKAVALKEALSPGFKKYQQHVLTNAKALARGLQKRGFRIVSGGTDTHLMLVDVAKSKGMTGKEAEAALDEAGITVNKNAIPFDERPPAIASGIRLGTPIVTTRGMRAKEMDEIADAIAKVLSHPQDQTVQRRVRSRMRALCGKFPIFAEYR